MSAQVRVGVAVFILRNPPSANNNPAFLIGKRKGSHGAGTYGLPGGHLEFNESFENCAARELLEETGLKVKNVSFLTATNDVMADEGKHYVTIFMSCSREDESEEARLLEENKCEAWEWMEWSQLVEIANASNEGGSTGQATLFQPLLNLVSQRPNLVPNIVSR